MTTKHEEGPSTCKRNRDEEHGKSEKRSKCNLGREIDRRVFTYVSDLVPFSSARFGILQLGPFCNASMSCTFSEANCHVKTVLNENNLALILEFNQLFGRGIQLLRDVKENKRDLEEHELAAIKILDDFFKEKGQHEESLIKICQGHSDGDVTGTEITIALAEHLIGKLSPEKSYIIDSGVERKGKCGCGFNHCNSDPVFGSTGLGHEEVWHGSIDIILSSNGGIPETAASYFDDSQGFVTVASHLNDCEYKTEADNSGRKTSEMKPSLSCAESRAIAQTIVFSFCQRKRHPHLSNFLIPNVLISPKDFRIIMYDSVNDILICSAPLPIFQPYPSKSLQIASIIILWMVLHHRMFCGGIDTSSIMGTINEMEEIQSNFKDRAKEKLNIYINALKFGVQEFPLVPRESFPSYELLGFGVHLIPQTKS